MKPEVSVETTILDLLLNHCRKGNAGCEIININPHEDGLEVPHWHLPLAATTAMEALDLGLLVPRSHSSSGGGAS